MRSRWGRAETPVRQWSGGDGGRDVGGAGDREDDGSRGPAARHEGCEVSAVHMRGAGDGANASVHMRARGCAGSVADVRHPHYPTEYGRLHGFVRVPRLPREEVPACSPQGIRAEAWAGRSEERGGERCRGGTFDAGAACAGYIAGDDAVSAMSRGGGSSGAQSSARAGGLKAVERRKRVCCTRV